MFPVLGQFNSCGPVIIQLPAAITTFPPLTSRLVVRLRLCTMVGGPCLRRLSRCVWNPGGGPAQDVHPSILTTSLFSRHSFPKSLVLPLLLDSVRRRGSVSVRPPWFRAGAAGGFPRRSAYSPFRLSFGHGADPVGSRCHSHHRRRFPTRSTQATYHLWQPHDPTILTQRIRRSRQSW